MKYKREFELNPDDIEVIESCLSKELHLRSEAFLELEEQHEGDALEVARSGISEITELLGKLHNQKIWFGRDPNNQAVPMG